MDEGCFNNGTGGKFRDVYSEFPYPSPNHGLWTAQLRLRLMMTMSRICNDRTRKHDNSSILAFWHSDSLEYHHRNLIQ